MTPEGRVKHAVKRVLKHYRAYFFMPVQNGMGAPALDFHCCVHGRAFFIETKAPGAKLTPRQNITVDEILKAGGTVFLVSDPTRFTLALRAYLQGKIAGRVDCL